MEVKRVFVPKHFLEEAAETRIRPSSATYSSMHSSNQTLNKANAILDRLYHNSQARRSNQEQPRDERMGVASQARRPQTSNPQERGEVLAAYIANHPIQTPPDSNRSTNKTMLSLQEQAARLRKTRSDNPQATRSLAKTPTELPDALSRIDEDPRPESTLSGRYSALKKPQQSEASIREIYKQRGENLEQLMQKQGIEAHNQSYSKPPPRPPMTERPFQKPPAITPDLSVSSIHREYRSYKTPPSDRSLLIQPPKGQQNQQKAAALKNQLLRRFTELEHEEPPQDPLFMSVLDRNQYFLEQKNAKLKQRQVVKEAKEVEECTFKPVIYTNISHRKHHLSASQLLNIERKPKPRSTPSLSRSSSASRLRAMSYTERYAYRRSNSTEGTPRQSRVANFSEDNQRKATSYSSLGGYNPSR